MKNSLLTTIAALACTLCAISSSSAQTATLSFNDGVGTPNAGTYFTGQSFSFNVMLNFAPGGSIANVEGISYWLQQNSGGPFNFAITSQSTAGSPFSVAQSPGASFPQSMAPSNANDLGAILAGSTGLGAGSYFLATITVSISTATANGTYFIGNTFAGGKTSVISDDQGHTFAIPQSTYAITVLQVPDGGSTAWLLSFAGLGLLGAVRMQRGRA